MLNTKNLSLNKIELTDFPDITVINPNWDTIDSEIQELKNNKVDGIYVDSKVASLVNGAPDTLDTLKELSEALGNDANFATTVANQIGNKVDKVTGKELSTNDYTTEEKTKLAGIDVGANKYTHPITHHASIIIQDASNRFVTDAEKNAWNDKANSAHGNHVPSTQTVSNSVFLRNDNTWASVTPSNIGAIPTTASCNKNWNWSGQDGQPNWLWGGHDGTNMYVYNPSNFSVNYANSSGDTNTVKGRDICAEVDSLKSTVVNGKTSVANAINGKSGTSLSNQSTFDEMASAIKNFQKSADVFEIGTKKITGKSSHKLGSYVEGCYELNAGRKGRVHIKVIPLQEDVETLVLHVASKTYNNLIVNTIIKNLTYNGTYYEVQANFDNYLGINLSITYSDDMIGKGIYYSFNVYYD